MYDFVKWDESAELEKAIEAYEEAADDVLFAGDERRLMINSMMYMVTSLMEEINYRANNNLVATCDEETLELFALQRNVQRIEARKASMKMLFSTDEAILEDIEIPAGTRVTSDGVLFFKTIEKKAIKAGDISVEVIVEATEGGAQYNELSVGKANILVDTIPYITEVRNITQSDGGSDRESTEAFRERVLNAPKGYATTGSDMAYIQKTKEVDSSIVDVVVDYIEESEVCMVYVLCENGALPDEVMLQKIIMHIGSKEIKALSDKLEVLTAVEKKYDISCSYKISAKDEEKESEIKKAVEIAIEKYKEDTMCSMGIAINPEILKKYMYNAGAASVEVTEPTYMSIEKYEVAKCNSMQITYGGILE